MPKRTMTPAEEKAFFDNLPKPLSSKRLKKLYGPAMEHVRDMLHRAFTEKPTETKMQRESFEVRQAAREKRQLDLADRYDSVLHEYAAARTANDTKKMKLLQNKINEYNRKIDTIELEGERERLARYKAKLKEVEQNIKECRDPVLQCTFNQQAELLDNLIFDGDVYVGELETRLGLRPAGKKKAVAKTQKPKIPMRTRSGR